MTITVTNQTEYHHMPDYFKNDRKDLNGMTLRQALTALRGVHFGDIGGTHQIDLSDGTYLVVELTPASDPGAYMMGSQRVTRYEWNNGIERVVRRYSLD